MNVKEGFKSLRANILGFDPGFLPVMYRWFYRPKAESHEGRLETLTSSLQSVRFLQIGGNDGFINDPLFKLIKRDRWQGIIVEPQREVFEKRLKKTYRHDSNVILENVAIAEQDGQQSLYKLSFSNSRWATGLASFNREVLVQELKEGDRVRTKAAQEGIDIPDRIEDCITTEEVPCYTIGSLMEKHGFASLDLLQIDVEGYEYEIIKTIPFSDLKPTIINYEHAHLNAEDRQACSEYLKQQGYQIEEFGGESLAHL